MKKIILLLITCAVSFTANADVVIPKDRVICQSESAIKTFLARKKVSNKVAKLPSQCRRIEMKRTGEVKKRYKGYVKVKTRSGDNVFVDKDAIRRG